MLIICTAVIFRCIFSAESDFRRLRQEFAHLHVSLEVLKHLPIFCEGAGRSLDAGSLRILHGKVSDLLLIAYACYRNPPPATTWDPGLHLTSWVFCGLVCAVHMSLFCIFF